MNKRILKTVLMLLVVSIFTNIFAASDSYHQVMKSNIDEMYQTKNADELVGISAMFYRISEKETEEWLPLYYASYALVRITFFISDSDEIDKYLDEAQKYLDVLKKKKPEESELFVLQSLIYSKRITSPVRGMKYSMLSNGALDKAMELNNENARAFYCRGNNVFHTPSFYGGGKEKALPLFEKAKMLFEAKTNDNDLWPGWGMMHNNMMLNKCKEE